MPGHKVGQPRRLAGFRNGAQGFFGNVLADFGVAFEFVGHSTHQRVHRSLIAGVFRQTLRARLKERGVFDKLADAHPNLALNQHLHGAIGQLQKLQHIGQHTDAVDSFGGGIIDRRIDLRRQQNLLVIGHDLFQGADRFFTAHEQRNDHMGEHHDVPQRKHRVARGKGVSHVAFPYRAEGPRPVYRQRSGPSLDPLSGGGWWGCQQHRSITFCALSAAATSCIYVQFVASS